MKKKTKFSVFFIILAVPFILVIAFIVIIDPFFHYHSPIKGIPYLLSDERYQNDGIVKHFEYDAIISGSSETENLKASQVESLWGLTTVKTSFAGGSFKEVDTLIKTALESNDNVKIVIRSLDLHNINEDKDKLEYDSYPDYLYDNNILNDYKYIFNKDVILNAGYSFLGQFIGNNMTTFDEYASFNQDHEFGKEAVLRTMTRTDITNGETIHLTDDERETIRSNLQANILDTAQDYPDVTFYYFFPPYSAYYWDALVRTDSLEYILEIEQYTMELLLEQPNIRLYSFSSITDITGNPDNYMDSLHYSDEICSYILDSLYSGNRLLTKDNYMQEIEAEREVYTNFDYDSLFE